MRRATVYWRKKQFFVHASSRTTEGVWIASDPYLAVPDTCDDRTLGSALRAALDGSRLDVPHPQRWGGLLDKLLELAGVASWSTFAGSAACVEVEEDGEHIWVLPTRNLGSDGGFAVDAPARLTFDGGAMDEIAAGARRFLAAAHTGRAAR